MSIYLMSLKLLQFSTSIRNTTNMPLVISYLMAWLEGYLQDKYYIISPWQWWINIKLTYEYWVYFINWINITIIIKDEATMQEQYWEYYLCSMQK